MLSVKLTIVQARDLVAKDKSGTSDPYVKLQVGAHKFKTSTRRKDLNPNFHESPGFWEVKCVSDSDVVEDLTSARQTWSQRTFTTGTVSGSIAASAIFRYNSLFALSPVSRFGPCQPRQLWGASGVILLLAAINFSTMIEMVRPCEREHWRSSHKL